MFTIKRNKLIFSIVLLILSILIIRVFADLFPYNSTEHMMRIGISWNHQVYIQVTCSGYCDDTLDLIISTFGLFDSICSDESLDMNRIKVHNQFIKKLKDCISNDKPMNISSRLFDELKEDCIYRFDIDKELQEEFSKNGYQYYIEEGWIKGYKWPRDLDVGTIPIAGDKEKLHILNNLIYFLQKGQFRVYFMELSDDYCWGYQIY